MNIHGIPNSFDPDAMFRELETASEKMCDTQAQADQLEEMKKPQLAMLTLEYVKSVKSRIDAETKAFADQRYADFIEGMVEARRQANRAKARYHNLRALGEARRTQESSRRALAG